MKNLFNAVTLLSIAALFTSCAYENDTPLQLKANKANEAVADALKGKAAPDILKVKYVNLKATCTLARVVKTDDQSAAQQADDNSAPPAPPAPPAAAAKPVDNQGATTIIDFKAQAVQDPALSKVIDTAALEVADQTTKSDLKLVINPLSFKDTLTLNVDSLVYVMKHSPELSGSFTYSYNNGTSTLSNRGSIAAIDEQVPFKLVVLEETVGTTTYDHVLSCDLKGDVDPKNDAVKGQWIKVDCSGAVPTDADALKIYKSSCKPKADPSAPQATQ
ncbi:MAG: hypothetical protein ACXVAX_04985 [Pseudobdellovibrio sp.]